jgi:hypothetical protein
VRYLSGPSGSGKSHLLRELQTRALLAGRTARRVGFPSDDRALVARLIAFFRGADAAWPFMLPTASDDRPPLLALDDLHLAPPELLAALDAFRCRGLNALGVDVLATLREAPDGAAGVVLGALNDEAFANVCRKLGVDDAAEISALARMTERSPGWVVAARGRVPLTRDAILARASSLSRPAVELLARVALLGGVATEELASGVGADERSARAGLSELLRAALLTRRSCGGRVSYALPVTQLAPELAAALHFRRKRDERC